MTKTAGYDPAVGVLTAAVLLALFLTTMRRLRRALRVFEPRSGTGGRAGRGDRPDAPPAADYGLLVAVATVPTADDADMLREVLAEHGIRATVARSDAGDPRRSPLQVLVFAADAARAREVLATR